MLTRNGYLLDKKKYNKNLLKVIKEELTVSPFIPDDFKFGKEEELEFPVYKENKEYLAIPKIYGINKIGPPKIKFGQKNKAKIKFTGKLRDYQNKIVDTVLPLIKSEGGGLISIPPGRGKTVLAIYLAAKLKVKVLVLVHKTFLMEQWKERIEMFTNSSVGKIQQNTVDVNDHDFVIGMIQSISMKDTYDPELFHMFDFVIIDECFPGKTFLHTDKGPMKIGNLYKKWLKKEELPNILSFNKKTESFEYKKMTYAWKKTKKELIKIKMSKKIINCTPEHKILTTKGYVEANKLNEGDLIISKYDKNHIDNIISPALNEDQLQLIYGSYLGDGNISSTKMNRYRLRIIHCENQKEYCEWKANMFGINKLQYIENNGYSKKPAYRFNTKIFDLDYDLSKNRKNVPNWLINKLDIRGIAIWYMDDGSIIKKKLQDGSVSNYASLHTNNFSYETQLKFINKFNEYGINPTIHKSRSYYYLNFNKENTIKLFKLISPYTHNSMDYKICERLLLNSLSHKKEKYKWNNVFHDYGTLRVTSTSYFTNDESYVYDIEVKDNHNFVIATNSPPNQQTYIDGPVVSNCHHISSKVFSQSLLKMCSPYMLGLSATFRRSDRLEKVFNWHVGRMLYMDKELVECDKLVKRYFYKTKHPFFKEYINRYNGKANLAKMYTQLLKIPERNEFILKLVQDVYKKRKGTKGLLLSQRIDDIKNIKKYLDENTNIEAAEFHGKTKPAQRELAVKAELILSVYQFASEALDIPDLNCLIMVQSKKDLEQVLGRIFRKQKGQYTTVPLVIDIIDELPSFKRQAGVRNRKYKKDKFVVEDYKFDQEKKKIEFKCKKDYSTFEEVKLKEKDEFLE